MDKGDTIKEYIISQGYAIDLASIVAIAIATVFSIEKRGCDAKRYRQYFASRSVGEILQSKEIGFLNPCIDSTLLALYSLFQNKDIHELQLGIDKFQRSGVHADGRPGKATRRHLYLTFVYNSESYLLDFSSRNNVVFGKEKDIGYNHYITNPYDTISCIESRNVPVNDVSKDTKFIDLLSGLSGNQYVIHCLWFIMRSKLTYNLSKKSRTITINSTLGNKPDWTRLISLYVGNVKKKKDIPISVIQEELSYIRG